VLKPSRMIDYAAVIPIYNQQAGCGPHKGSHPRRMSSGCSPKRSNSKSLKATTAVCDATILVRKSDYVNTEPDVANHPGTKLALRPIVSMFILWLGSRQPILTVMLVCRLALFALASPVFAVSRRGHHLATILIELERRNL
jgi:hypothetical protein